MKTIKLMIAVMAVCLPVGGQAADDATQALQKGLFEEEANHNFDAAIRAYESVIKQFDQQQKLAATAVYRLGECYRKLGRTNEAVVQYQRLLRDFSDQTNFVNLSQQYLASLGRNKESGLAADATAPVSGMEQGHIQSIRAMIRNSPDLINGTPGSNPLLQAAGLAQLAVAEFLLTNGADIEGAVKGRGNTPLHAATAAGHKAMVELLLRRGAAPNARDGDGNTPLHLVAIKGFKAVTEALLAGKADPNIGNNAGMTPLHTAAGGGQVEIVSLLLAHGARMDVQSQNGFTPLHVSIANGQAAAAGLLVSNGSPVNTVAERSLVTPLHSAVSIMTNLVPSLLEKGADPNAVTSEGMTPLFFAMTSSGDPATLEILLQHGANPNVRAASTRTPLLEAVHSGKVESVKVLLKHGADLEMRETANAAPLGHTPLQLAFYDKFLEVAKVLIAAGADVNAKTYDGGTLLRWAATSGWRDYVALLLEHKADPNTRGDDGRTPLHMAAVNQFKEGAELLIAAGADVNALDNENKTPLTLITKSARGPVPSGALLLPAPPGLVGIANPAIPSRAIRAPGVSPAPAPVRESLSKVSDLAAMLRERGAEDMPLRDSHIWVHRPDTIPGQRPLGRSLQGTTMPWFAKGTKPLILPYNRFTLFDLLANLYSTSGGGFHFPDWSEIVVERFSPTNASGAKPNLTRVNVARMVDVGDCSIDVELQWGDVVIIPEADHPLSAGWNGLTPGAALALAKCLQRSVVLVIKENATRINLWPRLASSSQVAPSESGSLIVPDFRLNTVVRQSNLIRASSDVSQMVVMRRNVPSATTNEFIFALPTTQTYDAKEDLWLREGDVILIPDKGEPHNIARAKEVAARALPFGSKE